MRPEEAALCFAGFQVMLCEGYDRSADYWAYGVLVFEILAGFAPFASSSDRQRHHKALPSPAPRLPERVLEPNPQGCVRPQPAAQILTATVTYPDFFENSAVDLVSRLCVRNVSHRLGMMAGGIDAIFHHAWFAKARPLLAQQCRRPGRAAALITTDVRAAPRLWAGGPCTDHPRPVAAPRRTGRRCATALPSRRTCPSRGRLRSSWRRAAGRRCSSRTPTTLMLRTTPCSKDSRRVRSFGGRSPKTTNDHNTSVVYPPSAAPANS